jgi:hypothetical protein
MATTQRSSLSLPANLRHELLCHPYAPGVVFSTNLVRVLRSGARKASLEDPCSTPTSRLPALHPCCLAPKGNTVNRRWVLPRGTREILSAGPSRLLSVGKAGVVNHSESSP